MTDNEQSKPGRPHASGIYGARMKDKISVMFPPGMIARIKQQAATEKMKPSTLIRTIVAEALS